MFQFTESYLTRFHTLPFPMKQQEAGPCKLACPSFATCPTSLVIPKAWPGPQTQHLHCNSYANSYEQNSHFISDVGISVQSIFSVSTSRCLHFAFKAPRVVWSSELDVSHNVVERYRKRLLQCFGRVQCAIASCFLVHKFCIYIA